MQQIAIFDNQNVPASFNAHNCAPAEKKLSVGQMVQKLKQCDMDYEYYPTTDEIIHCVKADIAKRTGLREGEKYQGSVLDIGAADGRVVSALTDGQRYAIEKSLPLIEAMPADVFMIGTDFFQQTLIDKKISTIFCNPPYSQWKDFVLKIIKEANASCIYLVIPERWANDVDVANAIKARQAKHEVIGKYDFFEAERKARAKVDVVRISLSSSRYYRNNEAETDPFNIWFDEHFKINAKKNKVSDWEKRESERRAFEKNIQDEKRAELVKDEGLVKMLETIYNNELNNLFDVYTKMTAIDADLLNELNVSISSVQESLKLKIKSLKDGYWRELFDGLKTVTDKLSTKSRERMLDKLTEHTSIDFNFDNATALVLWVIKSANAYFDSQIIELVESMTESASVVLYKSNERTFGEENWRYNCKPELGKYGLDYRFILHRCGGISNDYWNRGKLANRASNLINDLVTVAGCIGFDASCNVSVRDLPWSSGYKNTFYYTDITTGEREVLFTAKAYLNGNLHLALNQSFIKRLNVMHGKLKGWLKTAEQAAEELDIPISEAQDSFRVNMKLGDGTLKLITG